MSKEKSILIPEKLAIKEPDIKLLNIINNKIFPPSNAGIGNKLVIPSDTDITANI